MNTRKFSLFMEKDNKALLDSVLNTAIEGNASDVHLTVGEPYCFRIGSEIVRAEAPPLNESEIRELIFSILTNDKIALLEETGELDLSYESISIKGARFRVNMGKERKGFYSTFRIIPHKIRRIENLGFPNDKSWKDIISLNKGLVLVTGATGSGKSTTLASLIQKINEDKYEKIITIEDPIEYIHESKKALIIQREVGKHTQNFYAGVKWSLRQDPDIILVGEIRDKETARAALIASETGHLVFSTLHTKDSVGTIGRYIDLFDSHEQSEIKNALSSNLSYVISQQLVPYERVESRTLAVEIMKNISAIGALIRKGNIHQIQGYIESNSKEGMITMDRHLEDLCIEGKISQEVAIEYASNRDVLENTLKRRNS